MTEREAALYRLDRFLRMTQIIGADKQRLIQSDTKEALRKAYALVRRDYKSHHTRNEDGCTPQE